MAFSLSDIFKTTPAPVAAPQQPATGSTPVVPGQPGNITDPTVVADPNNHTAPVVDPNAVVANPPDKQEEKSPLDEFKNLWETAPTDPNASKPTEAPQLTAAAVQEVVAKADFSSVITPENLAAITAGGEDATKAFAASMNAMAAKVMTDSIMVNHKLTEQAVAKVKKEHEASLPDLIKNNAATDHLRTANPLFTNPAIKPVADAIHLQLQTKNPDFTHEQLTDMTQQAIIAMGESFAPKDVTSTDSAGDTDWTKFLEVG